MERSYIQLNDLDANYDNVLLLGKFNLKTEEVKWQDFCDNHD